MASIYDNGTVGEYHGEGVEKEQVLTSTSRRNWRRNPSSWEGGWACRIKFSGQHRRRTSQTCAMTA